MFSLKLASCFKERMSYSFWHIVFFFKQTKTIVKADFHVYPRTVLRRPQYSVERKKDISIYVIRISNSSVVERTAVNR